MGLGRYLLKKKISAMQKSRKVERTGLNVSRFKTIGILSPYLNEVHKNALLAFKSKLEAKGYSVSVLVYHSTSIPKNVVPSYPFFTSKDLSYSRTPKKEVCKQFANTKFDLLINYYLSEKDPLHYLSAVSPAGIRVAANTLNENIGDVFLSPGSKPTIQEYENAVWKYLAL